MVFMVQGIMKIEEKLKKNTGKFVFVQPMPAINTTLPIGIHNTEISNKDSTIKYKKKRYFTNQLVSTNIEFYVKSNPCNKNSKKNYIHVNYIQKLSLSPHLFRFIEIYFTWSLTLSV